MPLALTRVTNCNLQCSEPPSPISNCGTTPVVLTDHRTQLPSSSGRNLQSKRSQVHHRHVHLTNTPIFTSTRILASYSRQIPSYPHLHLTPGQTPPATPPTPMPPPRVPIPPDRAPASAPRLIPPPRTGTPRLDKATRLPPCRNGAHHSIIPPKGKQV